MSFMPFLQSSEFIDHDHPDIVAKARALRASCISDTDIAGRCFEFVRDAIKHSGDHMQGPITIRASDVLRHGTGYCYAKSHLLAALLRACGLPAGLCYQRLSVSGADAPFCLHGLNAVHLPAYGWYRLDPRGNKPGVSAGFSPPVEQLAFPIRLPQECDFPEIWPAPLPRVVEALRAADSVASFHKHYPDMDMAAWAADHAPGTSLPHRLIHFAATPA